MAPSQSHENESRKPENVVNRNLQETPRNGERAGRQVSFSLLSSFMSSARKCWVYNQPATKLKIMNVPDLPDLLRSTLQPWLRRAASPWTTICESHLSCKSIVSFSETEIVSRKQQPNRKYILCITVLRKLKCDSLNGFSAPNHPLLELLVILEPQQNERQSSELSSFLLHSAERMSCLSSDLRYLSNLRRLSVEARMVSPPSRLIRGSAGLPAVVVDLTAVRYRTTRNNSSWSRNNGCSKSSEESEQVCVAA